MYIIDDGINNLKISEIIRNDLLKDNNQMSKYLLVLNLENNWKKIVGDYIYEKTQINYKEEGILKVYSDYSSVKTEIFLRRENLINQINDLVNMELIKNIEVL